MKPKLKRVNEQPSPSRVEPVREPHTLFSPRPGDASVRGHYRGHVMQSSAYTEARLRRRQAPFGLAIAGATVALLDRAGALGTGD
jgi:hypothetical protein